MKHILIIILFFNGMLLAAQEDKPISLEEVVSAALENSRTLKIMEEEVKMVKADYQQSQAVFLPNITASYTGYTTTNPLMAFGSKLNQEIISATDFAPELLNDPNRTNNFATKIEIQQPLINLDGIYQRKAAKASYSAVQQQMSRSKDYVALEVQKVYMQLQLSIKTVEVIEKVKLAVLENLEIAKNSYKQGLLQRSDVLAIEVRVTEVENQLQYANSNVKNISNNLSVLINDETFRILKPTDSLSIMVSSSIALKLPETRSDIQAMNYTSKAYEKMYQSEKLNFLPRLNAFGSYELYDDTFFEADASGYLIGAQLSWNLFEGSSRFGKIAKSRATLAKSKNELDQYKMESQMEMNKAIRMVENAQNNLKLTELAMDQSRESLRIRTNRYKEGLEKTVDLLLAESQYAQKQLDYYSAIFQWNYAQLYVQFLSK
jgi:outer membrane protein TolC